MRRSASTNLAVLVPGIMICGLIAQAEANKTWDLGHTRPDAWEKPRIFHIAHSRQSPDTENILRRVGRDHEVSQRVLSPNDAYWFGWNPSKPDKQLRSTPRDDPGRGLNLVECDISGKRAVLYIDNERDYLIELLLSAQPRRYAFEAGWVNEKLLMIRFFDARYEGIDLIVDVEEEKILYAQNMALGGLAYQQWQQAKKDRQVHQDRPGEPATHE